ncbi:molybdenum cofactor sulfurase, putative [Trichomonas vaginalis G3]|uniref:Molybdenum cofactor sulfurase, putative n=1 Tax=Trichomonas vaginalis (strain ATCC PRA-98 / G3) TaxID=412133 RepID=A2F9P5_TRIV3|nr:molybdenum cofactor sulfurtransferase protein [Trichomonas vaginalis G3]EAX98375.1 molybdenum cofactor sulfurase, putative [Trichomonas vaginalis G3]KAI5536649.1 molybdenum cofactor sulfurtransferase protein [Trichomonas vaginalis G3]|eukprot:XP_001311305.1 molybdenum cofactor sulfurase [Trichomonas vaginalis G3]
MKIIFHFLITIALVSGIIAAGCYQFFVLSSGSQVKRSVDLLGYSNENSYGNFVQQIREKFTKSIGNDDYLDYSTRSLYTDAQIQRNSNELSNTLYGNPHSESRSSEAANELIEDLRISILEMFNTDLSEYTCVFTQSRLASLKLIPEAFPFTDKSSFLYSSSSDADIIGLSSFAAAKKSSIHSFNTNNTLQPLFSKFSRNSNNIVITPLVDRFDGHIFTEEEITEVLSAKSHGNYTVVLADATDYLQTNTLDLSAHQFDGLIFSIDGVVGFPSLGVVIIKNQLIRFMDKPYFGGGTLVYALTTQPFEKLRLKPAQRLEDGSLPFLTIAAAVDSIDILKTIGSARLEYVNRLSEKLYDTFSELKCVKILGNPSSSILSFEISSENGVVDYNQVVNDACDNGFVINSGCNKDGKCAAKVSIGWLSLESDITRFADWINQTYCE